MIAVLLMLAAACALHAGEGQGNASTRRVSSEIVACSFLDTPFVTVDFNHDNHPDGAVLVRDRNELRIDVHFRFQPVRSIRFSSTEPAFAISVQDVDRDGNPDIVVEEPFTRQRLFVWLNDGHGWFRKASVKDFPSRSDPDGDRLVSPRSGHESFALAGPGKMRSRQATPFSRREMVATAIVPFRVRVDFRGAASDSVPNLVRGSPGQISLQIPSIRL